MLPKLQGFTIDRVSRRAISSVPIELTVNLSSDETQVIQSSHILQSDHVGYFSYTVESSLLARSSLGADALEVNIRPYFDSAQEIVYTSTQLSIEGLIVHPISISLRAGFSESQRKYPAMIGADVRDWKASPLSFGTRVFSSQNTSGCEPFALSSASTRVARFNQVITSADNQLEELRTRPQTRRGPGEFSDYPCADGRICSQATARCIRRARIVYYETRWTPLSHALGDIVYTLTLAPCEHTNIAVIDWAREETAIRNEDQRLSESLDHTLHRDAILEEVVDATIKEVQKGKSFLGGTAGTGGYGSQGGGNANSTSTDNSSQGSASSGGASSGGASNLLGGGSSPFSWGVWGSHALGIGKARSEGEREVEANTTKKLSDMISQAGESVRSFRSTVVRQGIQKESESVNTRTVRNHNHCHALTVLYYELVRHYLVETKAVAEQDVIMLKRKTDTYCGETLSLDDINGDNFEACMPTEDDDFKRWISIHRKTLDQVLIDERLRPGFDEIENELYHGNRDSHGGSHTASSGMDSISSSEDGDTEGYDLEAIQFRILVSEVEGRPPLLVSLVGQLYLSDDEETVVPIGIEFPSSEGFDGWVSSSTINLEEPIPRSRLRAFEVGLSPRFRKQPLQWRLDRLILVGNPESTRVEVFDSDNDSSAHSDDTQLPTRLVRDRQAYFSFPDSSSPEPRERSSAPPPQVNYKDLLVDHITYNSSYYLRALWLSEDPNDRIDRLWCYLLPNQEEDIPLTDVIHADPVGIYGDFLVFLAGDTREVDRSSEPPETDDRRSTTFYPSVEFIQALPSRGTYAETKLSECNSCEITDNNRFWDWTESPCPDNSPEIEAIRTGSRASQTDLEPTQLPNPIVNIQGAPPALDSQGLLSALGVLKTPNIFRDMSGIDELGPLLQKLADVAAGTRSDSMQNLRNIHARNELARDSANRGEISQEQRDNIIRENLEGSTADDQPSRDPSPRPRPDPPTPDRPRPGPPPPPSEEDTPPVENDEPDPFVLCPDPINLLAFQLRSFRIRSSSGRLVGHLVARQGNNVGELYRFIIEGEVTSLVEFDPSDVLPGIDLPIFRRGFPPEFSRATHEASRTVPIDGDYTCSISELQNRPCSIFFSVQRLWVRRENREGLGLEAYYGSYSISLDVEGFRRFTFRPPPFLHVYGLQAGEIHGRLTIG